MRDMKRRTEAPFVAYRTPGVLKGRPSPPLDEDILDGAALGLGALSGMVPTPYIVDGAGESEPVTASRSKSSLALLKEDTEDCSAPKSDPVP